MNERGSNLPLLVGLLVSLLAHVALLPAAAMHLSGAGEVFASASVEEPDPEATIPQAKPEEPRVKPPQEEPKPPEAQKPSKPEALAPKKSRPALASPKPQPTGATRLSGSAPVTAPHPAAAAPPPKIKVGSDKGEDILTVAWIPYEAFEEMIAPQGATEQPALQSVMDPVANAKVIPDPNPTADKIGDATVPGRPTPAVKPEQPRVAVASAMGQSADPWPATPGARVSGLTHATPTVAISTPSPIPSTPIAPIPPKPDAPVDPTLPPEPDKSQPKPEPASVAIPVTPQVPAQPVEPPKPDSPQFALAAPTLPEVAPVAPLPASDASSTSTEPKSAVPESKPDAAPSAEHAAGSKADIATSPDPKHPEASSAPKSDRESLAVSLKEGKPLKIVPGSVITGQGLEIKTVQPRFSTVTLNSSIPRNPDAVITFKPETGEVLNVTLTKSSGYADIDGPVLASLYRWKAAGSKLAEFTKPFDIPVHLILVKESD